MAAQDICILVKRPLPGELSPAFHISDLLDHGVPVEDVQYLLGHSDPRTTRLYDRREQKVTRNLVERISIYAPPTARFGHCVYRTMAHALEREKEPLLPFAEHTLLARETSPKLTPEAPVSVQAESLASRTPQQTALSALLPSFRFRSPGR